MHTSGQLWTLSGGSGRIEGFEAGKPRRWLGAVMLPLEKMHVPKCCRWKVRTSVSGVKIAIIHRLNRPKSSTREGSPLFLCTPYWTPRAVESRHFKPTPARVGRPAILACLPDRSAAPDQPNVGLSFAPFQPPKPHFWFMCTCTPPTISFT
jgi:hypothetical protein